MTISFYLRRKKHIYCRIRNGYLKEVRTGITVEDPNKWDGKRYYDPRKIKYSGEINEQIKRFGEGINVGRTLSNQPTTLIQALNYHVDQALKLGKTRESTYTTNKSRIVAVEAWIEFYHFDDIPLDQISMSYALSLRLFLELDYAPHTISNIINLVRASLDTVLEDFEHYKFKNYFASKKIYQVKTEGTRKLDYLDPSLEVAFWNFYDPQHTIHIQLRRMGIMHARRMMVVALYMWNSGASFADLCTKPDITTDMKGKKILCYKRQKTGVEARVVLHHDLGRVLHLIQRGDFGDGYENWLPIQNFIKSDGQINALEYRKEYGIFKYYCDKVLSKIVDRKVTPHMLRHSFAVKMLEMGFSSEVVKEMMGHASIKTFETYYGHITTQRLINEAINLNTAI